MALPPSVGWGEPDGAIAQTARTTAHDFNNVLTTIIGSLALAERHAAGNPKLIRLLGNMRLAAERGTALAQALMESAGAEPGTRFGNSEELEPPPACTRVLVVEDDAPVAEVAREVLMDLGLEVDVRADAHAALESLQGGTAYGLVFSDIVMPGGMSGIELAETILATYPKLPVLLATGFSSAALAPGALRFPVLAKPYSVSELARRVKELLP